MDTILAYGATGDCVVKLTALARAAGIEIPQKTDGQVLDGQEIETILSSLGLADASERAAVAGAVYKGLVVDQKVWDALRAAAAANTGLAVPVTLDASQVPAGSTGDGSTPATGDGSVPAATTGQPAVTAPEETPSPQAAGPGATP